MTITNNNCGDQGQDVAMNYTDTTTKQVLTEDKEQLKEFSKGPIMVKKKLMDDDNNTFLTLRTLKCHLIPTLALKLPIQKDSSHKCHVAIFGYKILWNFGTSIHQTGIKG
jgi:hypothetical protein